MFAKIENGAVLLWPLSSSQDDDPSIVEVFVEEMPPFDNRFQKPVIQLPHLDTDGHWKSYYVLEMLTEQEIALWVDDLYKAVQTKAQDLLDDFVKTRKYDNALSAISYQFSKNPIRAAEAEYVLDMRDNYWDFLEDYVKKVLMGEKPMPSTPDEVVSQLPPLVWPVERPA